MLSFIREHLTVSSYFLLLPKRSLGWLRRVQNRIAARTTLPPSVFRLHLLYVFSVCYHQHTEPCSCEGQFKSDTVIVWRCLFVCINCSYLGRVFLFFFLALTQKLPGLSSWCLGLSASPTQMVFALSYEADFPGFHFNLQSPCPLEMGLQTPRRRDWKIKTAGRGDRSLVAEENGQTFRWNERAGERRSDSVFVVLNCLSLNIWWIGTASVLHNVTTSATTPGRAQP